MSWNPTTRDLHRKIERRDAAIETLEQDEKLLQKDLEWHRKEMWGARKKAEALKTENVRLQELLKVSLKTMFMDRWEEKMAELLKGQK